MEYFKQIQKNLMAFVLLLVFSLIFMYLLAAAEKSSTAKSVPAVKAAAPAAAVQSISAQDAAAGTAGQIVYGKSGLGANLVCQVVKPDAPAQKKVLMTFEVHGYEDLFAKDGQKLVDIGHAAADYFANNRGLLNGAALYIVASANPDGLSNGTTNNGPGRCQISLGVNINRDFSYNFIPYSTSRDLTQSKPFAAPESQALRDLVTTLKPDAVIDCHGWEDNLIGDASLSGCFASPLRIYRQSAFSTSQHGYFSAWAGTQSTKAMLLELPPAAAYDTGKYASGIDVGLQNVFRLIHP